MGLQILYMSRLRQQSFGWSGGSFFNHIAREKFLNGSNMFSASWTGLLSQRVRTKLRGNFNGYLFQRGAIGLAEPAYQKMHSSSKGGRRRRSWTSLLFDQLQRIMKIFGSARHGREPKKEECIPTKSRLCACLMREVCVPTATVNLEGKRTGVVCVQAKL